jgi:hypothetical protein
MSVQITAHDARRTTMPRVSLDAYYNLMEQVTTHEWANMDNVQKQHAVDQLLKPYNGRLCVFEFQRVVLEFDTQEDATQFMLTWS